MIVELLISLCTSLLKFILSWVNLPPFPDSAKAAIDTYMGYIFDNLNFLSFFINISTLKTVAGIAIILFTFSHLYKIFIWIIHKIPVSMD